MVSDFMLEDVKRAGMLIFKAGNLFPFREAAEQARLSPVRVSQIQTDNATVSKHSHNPARSGR